MPTRSPDDWLPLPPRDLLILIALADGVQHGYGLIRHIAESTRGAVAMDPANLYRALKRMRRDGLVTEVTPDAQEDAVRRRCYALTPVGQHVLSAEARRIDELAAVLRARRLLARGSGR